MGTSGRPNRGAVFIFTSPWSASLGCNTGHTMGKISHTIPVTHYITPIWTPYPRVGNAVLLDSPHIPAGMWGFHWNPQEWNILNKIAYIYGLYYICIYWSAYIYLKYYFVPFNIKNTWAWDMLPCVSTLSPHVSPLPPCHTHSQLSLFHNIS